MIVPFGSPWVWALVGFVVGSVGALGHELLDRFAGRSLEVYCRVKKNRNRFGEILDHQDSAITGSEYLQMMGTVIFLMFGTLAVCQTSLAQPAGDKIRIDGATLITWGMVSGALIMLTHSWIPGAVTRFASAPLLYFTWPFWRLLGIAMSPLQIPSTIVEVMTRRLAGKEENKDEDEEQLEDEISTIIAAGTREGYFGPGVREMIQGVMELHEDTVGHIMTPRVDVDAIDATNPWPVVLQRIAETGRTRYPVYENTIDNIVGVLYVKDLLPFLAGEGLPDRPIVELCRRPWAVPKDRSVELLLREFLHSRSHMAIVLDEFQQTAGVVTIEDALEEIVGEIVDESDEEEEFAIRTIDDHTLEVDGRVMVDDLNEAVHWNIPESEDYETIAGMVLYHSGVIPDPGHRMTVGDLEVEVLRSTNRKIEQIRLAKVRKD